MSSFLSLLTVLLIVHFAFEDFEQTLLSIDRNEQIQLFLSTVDTDQIKDWRTEAITAIFIPEKVADYPQLPDVFKGMKIPFAGEVVDADGHELDVQAEFYKDGHYYFAKNIEPYEQRESYFGNLLVLITLAILVVTVSTSILVTKSIVKPLKILAVSISRLKPEHYQKLPESQHTAKELASIAQAFNQHSSEIHQAREREKRMIGMASHELRTPIAVISGAIELLERDDKVAKLRPFLRLKTATEEMRQNTESLLRLSRHTDAKYNQQFNPVDLIPDIIRDLCEAEGFSENRVAVKKPDTGLEFDSDQMLIRILLRNLIQNALRHTEGLVTVSFTDRGFSIADESPTLPEHAAKYSTLDLSDRTTLTGLGFYIVTLIAERLNLSIHIEQTDSNKEIWVDCEKILKKQQA